MLDCRSLVARQIVDDDDVAGAQCGHKDMRHIGFEPVAVDRAVEHRRRDHAGHAQAGDQGGGLAVAVRETHPQAFALGPTTVAAGHIGRGPGFVDED